MDLLRLILGPKVSDWLPQFRDLLDNAGLERSTLTEKDLQIKRFKQKFGNRRIKSLTRIELQHYLNDLFAHNPHGAVAMIKMIRPCLQEAVNEGHLKHNPAEYLRVKKPEVIRRRLSIDGFFCIYKNIPDTHFFKRAVKLAITTGLRRSDIVKIKFGDIWDGYLHVALHKGRKRHPKYIELPLNMQSPLLDQTLGEIIDECAKYSDGEYLLCNTRLQRLQAQALTAEFYKYRGTRNIGDPSFHELRSLAERVYSQMGYDTKTLLGHSSDRQTNGYKDTRGLIEYKRVIIPTCPSPP